MKKNFIHCKEVINKGMANFLYEYLLLKKEVYKTLRNNRLLSTLNTDLGAWGDTQIKNSYCLYGDPALDLLLVKIKPFMEKNTNLKLIETYSYARLYKKGDILKEHKDRASCALSATMNLGGDVWPIHMELPNKIKIFKLNPGDLLIYKGDKLKHWRNSLEGDLCGQVFLHYNNSKNIENKYDGRPHLGLPAGIKKTEENK